MEEEEGGTGSRVEEEGVGGGDWGVVVVVTIVSIVADVVGEAVVDIKDVEDIGDRDADVDEVVVRLLEAVPETGRVEDAPDVPGGGRMDPVELGGFGDMNVVTMRVSVTVVHDGGGTTIVIVVNTVVTASGATVVMASIVFVMVELASETNIVVVSVTATVMVDVPAAGCVACRLDGPSLACDGVMFCELRDTDDDISLGARVASIPESSALLPARLFQEVAVIVAVCILLAGSMIVSVSNMVDIATNIIQLVLRSADYREVIRRLGSYRLFGML